MFNKDILHISSLSSEEVLKYLKISPQGLNNQEVAERQLLYGKNIMKQTKNFNFWRQFIKQFTSLIAFVLWFSGFLAIIIKEIEIGSAIFLVIIINGLFSFSQEYKTDKILSSLANMIPKKIQVYRNGKIQMISTVELTIGDIIFIENGTAIPADARIIDSNQFFVDNSMLSGETVPLNRTHFPNNKGFKVISEIPNLVYAGTTVSQGSAKAVVYAIGDQTQIGEVSVLAQCIDKGSGTLDREIHKIIKKISLIASTLAISAFFIYILSEILRHENRNISSVFKTSITVALGMLVANIPEGLLPTVNLSLAVGSQRMAKHNALIKKLSSVETLSSATVICTDKTGTLTKNQLTVRKILTPDGLINVTGLGYEKKGKICLNNVQDKKGLEKLLTASILCSEANININLKNPKDFEIIGSPTEGSLLIAASKYGYDINKTRNDFDILKVNSFTSERKKMSVLVNNNRNSFYDINNKYLFIKGVPNIILENCCMQYKNQKAITLSTAEKQEFLNKNNEFSSEGFRILAIAYKKNEQEDYQENDMVFLGFVINYDPPKIGVKEAIYDLTKAGLKTTIITGDYGITAIAIGKQVGIIKDDFININGCELDQLSKEELKNILKTDKPVIFSRTTPKHKLQIIKAYKDNGEIICVTGDGVNDILAMKAAHIGIAMGQNNKDIVFNAADMILLDDNFVTIPKALLEGRGIYENIKKFITYVFASNVPQIFPIILMAIFGTPLYLTVLQILAIDLLTDLIPAIALGAEEPDSSLLENKPRTKDQNLLDKTVFKRAYLFLGLIEGFIALFLFLYFYYIHVQDHQQIKDLRLASTMAFGGVIFAQIGNVFCCRSDKFYFWKTFNKKNKILYLGILCEFILFVLITNIPSLNKVFDTKSITLNQYLILSICPFIVLLFDTIWKRFLIYKKK
ncbi:P-type ATPase exporting cations [Candidatus Phytoplasma mali]|uniref:P-type ATPase exporting cations n=1 Tax=Phytoplasma mali (strain AT) TaxID=482235 RepID=B3QZM2_PHYMT|nr:cation-transporting P-type ATPase [Candidatus Phytoplasma mali]CAP18409.1 P-type ATPase exporting cations [Candidatus Phytoplasma mali]